MVGKNYQIPRPAQQEDNVFDDERTGRKKADKYSGVQGKANNPSEYKGRNIAKEQMTKEFKKGLRGKLYYGQEKV